MVDFSVEFAEIWQCCCSHPHNQILINVAIVVGLRAQVVHILVIPVWGVCETIPACNSKMTDKYLFQHYFSQEAIHVACTVIKHKYIQFLFVI